MLIKDKSEPVPYLPGIKGSPGISYDIQLPSSYDGSISISINQGDILLNAEGKIFNLSNIDVKNREEGNITISAVNITAESRISTGSGNVDISLSKNSDCQVSVSSGNGNVSVDDSYSSGLYKMSITNHNGNISVNKYHR